MAAGAVIVTVAEPILLASASEVAVTVTVPPAGTLAGALYKPAGLIVPMLAAPAEGLDTLQATAAFEVPETVAVNCCVWLVCTFARGGATATLIGGGACVTPAQPTSIATSSAKSANVARQ